MNPKPNNFSEEDEPSPETLGDEIYQGTKKTNQRREEPALNQQEEELNQQEVTLNQQDVGSGQEEEEPVPERNIRISQTPQKEGQVSNHHYTQATDKCKTNNNILKNQSLNVSKAYTCAPSNSIYENFDIQQLTYSLMKDYSQLKISKDENFMERMKFDIYKRQIKEERINKLVEQNKIKIDEEERTKAFNRLIEDANRRIEAQENLEAMKNKLEEDLIAPPSKKYKQKEWDEIYNERFTRFQKEVDKKNEEKIKQKQENERLKEEEEIELCKVRKAPKEIIQKLSKINYENSPSKYKKTIHSDAYNFMSDDEDGGEGKKRSEVANLAHNLKGTKPIQNKKFTKSKKIAVSEYNNKRFDMCNKQKNQPTRPVFQQRQPVSNQQKYNYNEEEDEEEERNAPKPLNFDTSNDIETKKLEIAAVKRLNNNDLSNGLPSNSISMKETDASRIVDHFFTKNLKH